MGNDLSKMFYKINEVSQIIGVPTSTLRYWEKEFPEINPQRSGTNLRFYNPNQIELLKLIKYLLKDRGLKIDAAKEQIRHNKANVSRKFKVIVKLEEVRGQLEDILAALSKRK